MPQKDDDDRGENQHATEANEERRDKLNSRAEGLGICPTVGFDLSKGRH